MFDAAGSAATAVPAESRPDLRPGDRLGRYEIVSLIGSGGMGMVYRARDTSLGRDVALKILPEVAAASDPHRAVRFEREARAAAALSDPNVVVLFDAGREGGTAYLVSELIEGETLRDLLSGQSLTLPKILRLTQGIASGLSAAHERGIVHRDLKPSNILISPSGEAKIADFGLAKLTDSWQPLPVSGSHSDTETAPTAKGTVLGTVGYMAPEQVRGERVDARSDIFSFGCVLYEMVTGGPAFNGRTPADALASILRDEPPSLWELAPRIPAELVRIVEHCLEKNPQERFQSARDLTFALRSIPCPSALNFGESVNRWAALLGTRLGSAIGLGVALFRAILLTIP